LYEQKDNDCQKDEKFLHFALLAPQNAAALLREIERLEKEDEMLIHDTKM
jgi:hypothetical protein